MKRKMMMRTKKIQKNNRKRVPMRMCAACRKRSPKKELVRFVLNNDRMPVIDRDGSLEGRGVNICPTPECFDNAIEKNAFNRAWSISLSRKQWEDVRKDFTSCCKRKEFRGGKGTVVHRITKEDAEKALDKEATCS
jgi:predicted RNA-binding protein YlxR (DUF448 family)